MSNTNRGRYARQSHSLTGGRSSWRSNFGRGRYFRGSNRGYFHKNQNAGGNVYVPSNELPLTQLSSTPVHVLDIDPRAGPYLGWKLYLPNEPYEVGGIAYNKLKLIEKYLSSKRDAFKRDDIESRSSFTIDVKNLSDDEDFKNGWPDLLTDLKDLPEKVISYFGLAMHQILSKEIQQELPVSVSQMLGGDVQANTECFLPVIHARFAGFEPVLQLKNLKANAYGKFISVKGTVVRVSNIKPLCTKMAFRCNSCEDVQIILQPYGRYTMPTKCRTRPCHCRSFQPLRDSPFTETVDWQSIRLQETIIDEQREGGRVPRTVECELMSDLVDSCVPGDIVTLSGIVKVNNTSDGKWTTNKDKCMFLLYILANSVTSHKGTNNMSSNFTPGGLELSLKDLYAVQAIQAEENLFRLIVASTCPSIYGHEVVKAGLVLGLFGGTHRFVDDSNRIPVRGDPHILIVGDPGLGKSQMLQSCSNIAPRGVYVCGNTTTASGLTVTLVKESGGEYALEAGALVLADQGCCCIDEFDKMTNQHHALLEAMEQQTISIAKGGIVCSLPARTSILAAANPAGGHYNKAKTVAENLKLGSALLSRFDLVFILLDKPDEELDSKLSEYVIALHAGKTDHTVSGFKRNRSHLGTPNCSISSQHWDSEEPLSEKLKFNQFEECNPIPHHLLRKYVAYARKYVHPKLLPDAATVLQKFYLDLRKRHLTADSTPITTRQLESLIRLTQARARLELRETCTAKDAQDVVEIMQYSMLDTYSDELGLLDFQRLPHGSGMSSRSKAKKFVAAITKIAQRTSNSYFTVTHMKQIAKDVGLQIVCFEEFIISLNNQGFLLKKGPKLYQLQTTEF